MKLHPFAVLVAMAALLSMYETAIAIVSADIMVKYIFNNGLSPSANVYCSDTDYVQVDAIFTFENVNRRQLRDSSISTLNKLNTKGTMSRQLPTYPRYCKNYCAKYVSGTCRATRCVGYRRSLRQGERNEQSVSVNMAKTCTESLRFMQTQLDTLISNNLVSPPCQLFLQNSTRTATCYDDVVYGEVEGYRIWNVINGSGNVPPHILHESDHMTSGSGVYSFCKRTVFTIEVMTNDCVEHVQINVQGPKSYKLDRTESMKPYTVFSGTTNDNTDRSAGKIELWGHTMTHAGSYNVTIIPDRLPSKKKQFDFILLDC